MDPHTRAKRLLPVQASLGVDQLLLAAFGEERQVASLFQFDFVVSPGDHATRPDSTIGVRTFSSNF